MSLLDRGRFNNNNDKNNNNNKNNNKINNNNNNGAQPYLPNGEKQSATAAMITSTKAL
jgi:hypothetical protein